VTVSEQEGKPCTDFSMAVFSPPPPHGAASQELRSRSAYRGGAVLEAIRK